jgi:hypothetical protein
MPAEFHHSRCGAWRRDGSAGAVRAILLVGRSGARPPRLPLVQDLTSSPQRDAALRAIPVLRARLANYNGSFTTARREGHCRHPPTAPQKPHTAARTRSRYCAQGDFCRQHRLLMRSSSDVALRMRRGHVRTGARRRVQLARRAGAGALTLRVTGSNRGGRRRSLARLRGQCPGLSCRPLAPGDEQKGPSRRLRSV